MKLDLMGITVIMLISNQEQEENLPDFAVALAAQLGHLMTKPCNQLMDTFDFVVQEFLKKGSQMWLEADVCKVLKYVVTTAPADRAEATHPRCW